MTGNMVRAALMAVLAIAAVAVSGACSVMDGLFRQPLPPSETLALEALLLEGGGMIPGTQVVRVGWSPPNEDIGVDLIVIEQSISPDGPWEEVAAKPPSTGFHEETSIYRPGNFYYFRAFMTRNEEETLPAAPAAVWIPDLGALERTAPGVVAPPNRTPTPGPHVDASPIPVPTVGDRSVPFVIVPPTATPTPTPTPIPTP